MRNKVTDTKRDFLWNAIGSFVYAMASIVLAFAVIRIAGADDGGIFGFGFSTLGQQMFIIAYFGIRPFHITDMKKQFSFGDYLCTRRITSLLAVLASFLFVGGQMAFGNYDFHKSAILLLLAGYKIVDGYADVYESELQRQGILYRTGQSLAFRTGISVVTLLSVLLITKNLLLAAAAADMMQLFGTWFFAVRVLSAVPEVDRNIIKENIKDLLGSTGLLFISVFVDFYIFSASKYAIDARLSDAVSGYFNVLFMPTSFIYLIANFLIRPMLTKLADQFAVKDTKAFRKTSVYMLKAVAMLSVVIILGAALFGHLGLRIFELILGEGAEGRLVPEYVTFILLIIGGSLYAFANVMYYILVTVREQFRIFAGYVMTAAVAVFSAERMVQVRGMFGGAMNYFMLMGILVILFSVFALQAVREMELETKK